MKINVANVVTVCVVLLSGWWLIASAEPKRPEPKDVPEQKLEDIPQQDRPEEKENIPPVADISLDSEAIWQSQVEAMKFIAQNSKELNAVDPARAKYVRYVHNASGELVWVYAATVFANLVLADIFGNQVVLPEVFDNGRVLRWDFNALRPRTTRKKLEDGSEVLVYEKFDLLELWDTLMFDESWASKTFDVHTQTLQPVKVKIARPAIDEKKGIGFILEELERDFVTDPLFLPYGRDEVFANLGTNNPVVSVQEFIRLLLTEHYYAFRGLPDNIDDLWKLLGVNLETIFRQNAANVAVIPASRVIHLDGVRRIVVFRRATRLDQTSGAVMWTHDFFPDKIKVNIDPARNLLSQKRDAGEVIFVMNNGGLAFYIEAGGGVRAQFAADNLAHDYTVTSNGDVRVQVGKSCLTCHLQNDFRGVQPFERLDLLAFSAVTSQKIELNTLIGTEYETEVIKAGRYNWDPDLFTQRVRDDFSDFVVKCSSGTMQPEDVGSFLDLFFRTYWDGGVVVEQAAKEVGFALTTEDDPRTRIYEPGIEFLQNIPPLNTEIVVGQKPEDVYISFLAAGARISRPHFLTIKKEILRRKNPQTPEPPETNPQTPEAISEVTPESEEDS